MFQNVQDIRYDLHTSAPIQKTNVLNSNITLVATLLMFRKIAKYAISKYVYVMFSIKLDAIFLELFQDFIRNYQELLCIYM